MSKEIKNVSASIHNRLLNMAKQGGQTFEQLFYYYTLERLLYRLSGSRHTKSFVLKGGLMFFCWGLPLRRPTRDIDLQGYTINAIENLEEIFREVCTKPVEPPDGMAYDPGSIAGEVIMDHADYQGIRLHVTSYLGRAVCKFHIDVSFANAITPGIITAEYFTLLETPSFSIQGYPYETSIAEKLHAIVMLDLANDRLKDFYDLWLIAQTFDIQGQVLVDAINNTFRTRKTDIPQDIPIALTDRFATEKRSGWAGFKKKLPANDPIPADFEEVLTTLRTFLLPPLQAAAQRKPFTLVWNKTTGWE